MEKKPKFVETYEQSEWRREDMTLLEFLRKSNDKGDIIKYIHKRHKQNVMEEVQTWTGTLENSAYYLHHMIPKLDMRYPQLLTVIDNLLIGRQIQVEHMSNGDFSSQNEIGS